MTSKIKSTERSRKLRMTQRRIDIGLSDELRAVLTILAEDSGITNSDMIRLLIRNAYKEKYGVEIAS